MADTNSEDDLSSDFLSNREENESLFATGENSRERESRDNATNSGIIFTGCFVFIPNRRIGLLIFLSTLLIFVVPVKMYLCHIVNLTFSIPNLEKVYPLFVIYLCITEFIRKGTPQTNNQQLNQIHAKDEKQPINPKPVYYACLRRKAEWSDRKHHRLRDKDFKSSKKRSSDQTWLDQRFLANKKFKGCNKVKTAPHSTHTNKIVKYLTDDRQETTDIKRRYTHHVAGLDVDRTKCRRKDLENMSRNAVNNYKDYEENDNSFKDKGLLRAVHPSLFDIPRRMPNDCINYMVRRLPVIIKSEESGNSDLTHSDYSSPHFNVDSLHTRTSYTEEKDVQIKTDRKGQGKTIICKTAGSNIDTSGKARIRTTTRSINAWFSKRSILIRQEQFFVQTDEKSLMSSDVRYQKSTSSQNAGRKMNRPVKINTFLRSKFPQQTNRILNKTYAIKVNTKSSENEWIWTHDIKGSRTRSSKKSDFTQTEIQRIESLKKNIQVCNPSIPNSEKRTESYHKQPTNLPFCKFKEHAQTFCMSFRDFDVSISCSKNCRLVLTLRPEWLRDMSSWGMSSKNETVDEIFVSAQVAIYSSVLFKSQIGLCDTVTFVFDAPENLSNIVFTSRSRVRQNVRPNLSIIKRKNYRTIQKKIKCRIEDNLSSQTQNQLSANIENENHCQFKGNRKNDNVEDELNNQDQILKIITSLIRAVLSRPQPGSEEPVSEIGNFVKEIEFTYKTDIYKDKQEKEIASIKSNYHNLFEQHRCGLHCVSNEHHKKYPRTSNKDKYLLLHIGKRVLPNVLFFFPNSNDHRQLRTFSRQPAYSHIRSISPELTYNKCGVIKFPRNTMERKPLVYRNVLNLDDQQRKWKHDIPHLLHDEEHDRRKINKKKTPFLSMETASTKKPVNNVVHLKKQCTSKRNIEISPAPPLENHDNSSDLSDNTDEAMSLPSEVAFVQDKHFTNKLKDSGYGTGSLLISNEIDSAHRYQSPDLCGAHFGGTLDKLSETKTEDALAHYGSTDNNIKDVNKTVQVQKRIHANILQIGPSLLDTLSRMERQGCTPNVINLVCQHERNKGSSAEMPAERQSTDKEDNTNLLRIRRETSLTVPVKIVQTRSDFIDLQYQYKYQDDFEGSQKYEVHKIQIDEQCNEGLRQTIDNRILPTADEILLNERPTYTRQVVAVPSTEIRNFLSHLKEKTISDHCGIIFNNKYLIASVGELGCFKEDRQYSVKEQLGSGGYGSAILCETTQSHNQFVIKKISRKKFQEEEILIPLHHRKTCDQMLDIYGIVVDGPNILILMEYAKGGTLLEWRDTFCILRDLPKFLLALYKLILGLRNLHHAGVSIFDIKESNIAFRERGDPSSVVFLDWGSAKDITKTYEDENSFKNGTRRFYPPERLNVLSDINLLAHDVWTLGCAALSFLNKRYVLQDYWRNAEIEAKEMMSSPQSGRAIALRKKEIFSKMITRNCHLILEDIQRVDQSCHEICPELLDCLIQMVEPDVTSRISAEDVLHHPVFYGLIHEENNIKRLALEYRRNYLPRSCLKLPFVKVRVLYSGKIIYTGILPRDMKVKRMISMQAYIHQLKGTAFWSCQRQLGSRDACNTLLHGF